ncbi:hypothetical protein COC69_02015 [Bacillus cereus]|uniref:Uncharacterized protein n=1 Tax=Bacillus cereus TaxID=1396 RepID=A0A9X7CS64_BACCE|nr:hypothetical protein [Bacillus cereus]PGS83525.1 hypothetical protein COC69_02015 [Bacillus cereus]
MKKDVEFINLILACEHIIKQIIPSSPENSERYVLMIEELKGLRETIKLNQLNKTLYYLSITQMLERNDPKKVIYAVLNLNEFYCNYYQIV